MNQSKMQRVLPISDIFHHVWPHLKSHIDALEYKKPDAKPVHREGRRLLYHAAGNILNAEEIDNGSLFLPIPASLAEIVSFDLGPLFLNARVKYGIYFPNGEALSSKDFIEFCAQRCSFLRDCGVKSIALENLNVYPTGAYSFVGDGGFISEVLEESGSFLLLDLPHAIVTAHYNGLPIEDYLEQLPLDKVIEVHVSSPGWVLNSFVDLHQPPSDEVWRITRELIVSGKCPNLRYIAIEYYEDPKLLIESYKKLDELLMEVYR